MYRFSPLLADMLPSRWLADLAAMVMDYTWVAQKHGAFPAMREHYMSVLNDLLEGRRLPRMPATQEERFFRVYPDDDGDFDDWESILPLLSTDELRYLCLLGIEVAREGAWDKARIARQIRNASRAELQRRGAIP